MSKVITFYDMPSTKSKDLTWSPNTWRTRYALNIKGIPYKSVWVEFPDIEETMKKIGAEPTGTRDGKPLYTAPTIVDPSTGAIVTDSIKIALYLDKQYPDTPKLFPDGSHALQAAFAETIGTRFLSAMFPICVVDINNQFTPRAQEWFRASREKMFGGAKLESVVPQGEKREEAIKAVLAVLDDINKWIEEGGEGGLFVGGDKPTHVDTVIAAVLTTIERTGNGESDLWKAIVAANGGKWEHFFKAFEQWASVAQ